MKHVMGATVAITGLFIFCGVVRGADEHERLRTELDATNLANEQLRQENATLKSMLSKEIETEVTRLKSLQPKLDTLTANVDSLIQTNAAQKKQIEALEQEKAKSEHLEHYYVRNERAWECSLGLTSIMAVKAYTPPIFYTAGAKVASFMPAVLTKWGASAISSCSPYALPVIGIAAATWLLKNIGTDIHKNWASDRAQFMKEKKVAENTNLSRWLSCQLLWHRFTKHTSRNVETVGFPFAFCVTGLRLLR